MRRGWVEFAAVPLACLIYLLLSQDGRAFRFLIHPLGLGVAAVFALGSAWLQHSLLPATVADMVEFLGTASPATRPAPAAGWLATLAVGMFPWWPFCLVAAVAGFRRGDYATAFWRFVACWSLLPMVLAAPGLLDQPLGIGDDLRAAVHFFGGRTL